MGAELLVHDAERQARPDHTWGFVRDGFEVFGMKILARDNNEVILTPGYEQIPPAT